MVSGLPLHNPIGVNSRTMLVYDRDFPLFSPCLIGTLPDRWTTASQTVASLTGVPSGAPPVAMTMLVGPRRKRTGTRRASRADADCWMASSISFLLEPSAWFVPLITAWGV